MLYTNNLAGETGLEPILTESKSAFLPIKIFPNRYINLALNY